MMAPTYRETLYQWSDGGLTSDNSMILLGYVDLKAE